MVVHNALDSFLEGTGPVVHGKTEEQTEERKVCKDQLAMDRCQLFQRLQLDEQLVLDQQIGRKALIKALCFKSDGHRSLPVHPKPRRAIVRASTASRTDSSNPGPGPVWILNPQSTTSPAIASISILNPLSSRLRVTLAKGYLPSGCTPQISRAYSITARSLENLPMLAVLRMVLRVHSSLLPKSSSTLPCVST
jgi:hypothetical protein